MIEFIIWAWLSISLYSLTHPAIEYNEPVKITIEKDTAPEIGQWTDEDEMRFDATIIDFKDTDEYKRWDGVEFSTETR